MLPAYILGLWLKRCGVSHKHDVCSQRHPSCVDPHQACACVHTQSPVTQRPSLLTFPPGISKFLGSPTAALGPTRSHRYASKAFLDIHMQLPVSTNQPRAVAAQGWSLPSPCTHILQCCIKSSPRLPPPPRPAPRHRHLPEANPLEPCLSGPGPPHLRTSARV